MQKINSGKIVINTYKDGVLSAMGHDLQLLIERFEISIDDNKIDAVFYTDSIVVDGALKNGFVDRSVLSKKDIKDIDKNISKKVLLNKKHAHISFIGNITISSKKCFVINGILELVGNKKDFSFELKETDGVLVGKLEIIPSEWGIPPFKALLGALKVQDRVGLYFEIQKPVG